MKRCWPCRRQCGNEEDTGCHAQGAGVCGPDESQGTATGAGHRADALDNRERCPVSGRLGVGMGVPEPGRPAGAQHVAPDLDWGVVYSRHRLHRQRLDRRGPERNPGRVAEGGGEK